MYFASLKKEKKTERVLNFKATRIFPPLLLSLLQHNITFRQNEACQKIPRPVSQKTYFTSLAVTSRNHLITR